MPALEALLDRFEAAHVQPLGVSVDSIFCHANWAASLGGVSFPLLADFHPKGAVASSVGLYLEAAGITDRATVIVDAAGIVRHASSVTPDGKRDMAELAALCEEIDGAWQGELPAAAPPAGLPPDALLFVKSACGHSRRVLLARDNLHLGETLPVRNVSEDAAARKALESLAGTDQAPCLVLGGKPLHEAEAIVRKLVGAGTGLWP